MSFSPSEAQPRRIDGASPQESPSESRLAPYPFDKACADIVIRTCDLVDFRVRRHILIEASPVFDTMFLLPQPSSDTESPHTPVVDLVEDSETIETLLRICYPIKNPVLDLPLERIETVLRAAMKYEMELPIAVLTDHILSLAERTPLPVWAAACRLGLEDVAGHAAQQLHKKDALDFNSLGAMDGISAGNYFRLREFHRTATSPGTQLPFLTPADPRNPQTEDGLRVWPPVPFSDDQPPTCRCRSSDGMEFGVHKAVLCAISDRFFEELEAAELTLDVADVTGGHDTQANAQETNLPVMCVNARAAVLTQFLAFCYPRMAAPMLYDLYTIADILCLAQEYHADAIAREVERLWELEAKTDPLGAYCAAVTRGLRERAQEAAKAMLNTSLDGVYIPELEDTPALAYHRLFSYHASCRAAATGVLERRFPQDPCSEPASSGALAAVPATPIPAPPARAARPEPASADVPLCGHQHGGFRSSTKKAWLSKYVSNICLEARRQPYNINHNVASVLDDANASGFWCPTCRNRARDLSKVCNSLREISSNASMVTLEL